MLSTKPESLSTRISSAFRALRRRVRNFFLFDRQDRPTVRAYAVYHAVNGSASGNPVYYAATRSEAMTAVSRMLLISHAQHYSQWCSLHNLHPSFPSSSWTTYLSTVLFPDSSPASPDDDYVVVDLLFRPRDFSIFLRMLSESDLLFLPFETREELAAFVSASSSAPKATDTIQQLLVGDPSSKPLIDSITKIAGKRH